MKPDKKNLDTKLNGQKYPKAWIIFTFSFIGSLLGAFAIGVFYTLADLWQATNSIGATKVFAPFLIAIVGWVFGFIPAFLTGLYVALIRFVIIDKKSYWKLFIIGIVITALYFTILFFLLFNDSVDNSDTQATISAILPVLGLLMVGGLSSVICGKWFVPKLKNL